MKRAKKKGEGKWKEDAKAERKKGEKSKEEKVKIRKEEQGMWKATGLDLTHISISGRF